MLKCGTENIDLVVLGRNYWSSCRVFDKDVENNTLQNSEFAELKILSIRFYVLLISPKGSFTIKEIFTWLRCVTQKHKIFNDAAQYSFTIKWISSVA